MNFVEAMRTKGLSNGLHILKGLSMKVSDLLPGTAWSGIAPFAEWPDFFAAAQSAESEGSQKWNNHVNC